MTIYYTLTFGVLVIEMIVFGIMVLPLPSRWRRVLFKFASTSPVVAKALQVLKIVFVFIFVLFIDTINRLQHLELESDGEQRHYDYSYETNLKAKKFYTQRNMYLTGFTLFLSLILERTSTLVLEVIKREEQVEALQKETKSTTDHQQRVIKAESRYKKEIAALSKELKQLKKKERDFETLRKQVAQQAVEYNRLADVRNKLETAVHGNKVEGKKNI